ncbi:hypothetical protein BJ508DRAFT_336944, partial [Ascobolus immersus RN42]
MRAMFKREMIAWAELFERHGFDFVTLFVDGFGGGGASVWGTKTGLAYEQSELVIFQGGIEGFSEYVNKREKRKHRSMYTAMCQEGMFPEMWNKLEAIRLEKRAAAIAKQEAANEQAAAAAAKPTKSRKRKRADTEVATAGIQPATGVDTGTEPAAGTTTTLPEGLPNSAQVPNPATITQASCPAPVQLPQPEANTGGSEIEEYPDPSSTQRQLAHDPFQQPATTPNLFAPNVIGLPTPAPSSPSVSANLFLNTPDTIAQQTSLGSSTALH